MTYVEGEADDDTDNFICSWLECDAMHWILECGHHLEVTYQFIQNEYILRSKMLESSCSIDPTSVF